MASTKRVLYIGGIAEEVDEKVLHAAFIPFGDISDIQIPLDYETEKHRGFAFIEFEMAEVSVRDWEGEILSCVEKAAAPI
ncbi:UNVERIFIED_CONTAM: hypothetical protein FKN15_069765 [Acipenser sinensis]